MGIYFIAAGSSSKNRDKTLDKSHSVEEMCRFLPPKDCERLRRYFLSGGGVYLWGANEKNANDVFSIKDGEYVVDVKNKVVVQVFRFCFSVKTKDTKLQEYVGWDREKPGDKKRPYRYVYFLSSPNSTVKKEKKYFQDAFGHSNNPMFLFGQEYFSDRRVEEALERTRSNSVEDFLGILETEKTISLPQNPDHVAVDNLPRLTVLGWLNNLILRIKAVCFRVNTAGKGNKNG